MKNTLLLICAVLLVGCAGTSVKRNFPDVPPELMAVCPELKQTEKTQQLSKVIAVVTENYAQYHECRIKVDVWIDWYSTQKKIFDEVK